MPVLSGKMKQIIGMVLIFVSAFCFYMATVTIRWSQTDVTLPMSMYVIGRFGLGFIVVCSLLFLKKRRPNPKNYHVLFGRILTNWIADYCVYSAVSATSVANANILNMTYPIFIAVFGWFLFKDNRDPVAIVIAFLSFIGVWLILRGEVGFDPNNFWGLGSGLFASVSLIYLNLCRQTHDTDTILFFVFGVGTLMMVLLFFNDLYIPNKVEWVYLILCSLFGIVGQFALTIGFRYVTALEGAIMSSSRILLAALLGPLLALESPLILSGWIGASLIFSGNVFLAFRKTKLTPKPL